MPARSSRKLSGVGGFRRECNMEGKSKGKGEKEGRKVKRVSSTGSIVRTKTTPGFNCT